MPRRSQVIRHCQPSNINQSTREPRLAATTTTQPTQLKGARSSIRPSIHLSVSSDLWSEYPTRATRWRTRTTSHSVSQSDYVVELLRGPPPPPPHPRLKIPHVVIYMRFFASWGLHGGCACSQGRYYDYVTLYLTRG